MNFTSSDQIINMDKIIFSWFFFLLHKENFYPNDDSKLIIFAYQENSLFQFFQH